MMLELMQEASLPFAPLIGVARLMRRAFLGQDLGPLGAVLLARAQANPDDANALMDCSTVLQLTGEREIALAVQAQAIAMQPLYSLPAAHALCRLKRVPLRRLAEETFVMFPRTAGFVFHDLIMGFCQRGG